MRSSQVFSPGRSGFIIVIKAEEGCAILGTGSQSIVRTSFDFYY